MFITNPTYKKFISYLVLSSSITLCFAASAPTARGGTSTSNLTVQAAVVASCTVAPATLQFPDYALAVVTSSVNLQVTCTTNTSYTVSLGAGSGSGATVTARKMTGSGAVASSTLSYNLYTDANYNTNFVTTSNLTGNGAAQSVTIYGKIPAGQNSPVGSYSDIVVATINF